MKSLSSVLCGVLLWTVQSAAAAPRYGISAIPEPDNGAQGLLQLGGFNNAGQVAGTWITADTAATPYLYTPGAGFANLLPPGESPGGFDDWRVYGLNDNGQAVGSRLDHAWQFAPGGGSAVPGTAAATRSNASAINDAGQVIGWADDRAYLHTPGQGSVALPAGSWTIDLNDTGQALLGRDGGPLTELYRYDVASGSVTQIALDPSLDPAGQAALNDRGDVMASQGFRLNLGVVIYHPDGTFTRVPDLFVGASEQANDINNDGWVVGRALRDGPLPFDPVPFLYTPEDGVLDLVALIDPSTLQGWNYLTPLFVNDRGDVAGTGVFNGEGRVFVLSSLAAPVPEPGTALLAGLGLVGVALGVRRRQASAASRSRENHADLPVL